MFGPGSATLLLSHLADVVVDGVGLPSAQRVAHGVKHAPSVDVELCHGDLDAVGVAVRSLSPVRRNRLQRKQNRV